MSVLLSATKSHAIPSYHVAFIEVQTPDTLTCHTWDASVTGSRRKLAVVNTLVRIRQRSCTLQVANASSPKRAVHCDQYLAVADLHINDDDYGRIHYPPLTSYTGTPNPSPTENYKQSRRSDWQKRNENCELMFYASCNLDACMSSPFLSFNGHSSLVSNFHNLGNVIGQETKTFLIFSRLSFQSMPMTI